MGFAGALALEPGAGILVELECVGALAEVYIPGLVTVL